MIHYHGTPVSGPRADVARFLTGRHALVPFFRPDDMGCVAEVCASFILDNSAFSVWRRGLVLDVAGYVEWVTLWARHPGLDWALIPDVIDGSEADNNALLLSWPDALRRIGVPVFHMHEDLSRLEWLVRSYSRVALGSSGAFSQPGAAVWWERMADMMKVACDSDGHPLAKLHGLRMMSPRIFPYLPLSSADSTNAGMNSGSLKRFGMYVPPSSAQRAEVIASRIEAHNSAPRWAGLPPHIKEGETTDA